MKINEKHSFRDYTHQSFTKTDVEEWNNTIVKGSCFHNKKVRTSIFPVGMTGVVFERCNLDNCVIPVGNTVASDCSNRSILRQNDVESWVVDAELDPIEPVNKTAFLTVGASIDPTDIPAELQTEPVTTRKRREEETKPKILSPRDGATTRDNMPTVVGTCSKNTAMVQVYAGRDLIGTAIVIERGNWAVTVGVLANKAHLITALATENDGSKTGVSNSITLTIDA